MGWFTEARKEIQRAIAMTKNLREQELLANRLKQIEKATLSGSPHKTSKIVRLGLLRKPIAFRKPIAIPLCNAKYGVFLASRASL